jgi:hypothetical protein
VPSETRRTSRPSRRTTRGCFSRIRSFAYELEKPSRTPRFDYTTVAARRQACETEVVHFDADQAFDPDRFEQSRHVAHGQWIPSFRTRVLTCMAEVRRDHRHAPSAGIHERAQKEQNSNELVVARPRGVSVQRFHEIHVTPANALEGTDLVLAVFEISLLVAGRVRPPGVNRRARAVAARYQVKMPQCSSWRHKRRRAAASGFIIGRQRRGQTLSDRVPRGR